MFILPGKRSLFAKSWSNPALCTSQLNTLADEALFDMDCLSEDSLSINCKGLNLYIAFSATMTLFLILTSIELN